MSAVAISDRDQLAISTIGASAPLKHLQTKFEITREAVVGAGKVRRTAPPG
jgi:hypothetical protein